MAKTIGSYIDNFIGAVAPKLGFERTMNRARMLNMQSQVRKYEGASDGRRASSWNSGNNSSVNSNIAKDHKKLVARSRDLAINNSYAKKAPWVIANNVVGVGILATPNVVDPIINGRLVPVKDKEKIVEAITAAWKAWADELTADYNGDFNFYGLQHLAIRTVIVSGEVLAIRKLCKQEVNKYGFQILILEADFIDTTQDTTKDKDGGYTFRGVKFDKNNKRAGYYLYDRHPNEGNAQSELVAIENIIHVYDVERSGQTRGVPASASTMTTQRDFADYMDAELLTKKGAACFSAIVQKAEDLEGDGTEEEGLEELQPGTIQYLKPGETIHFPSLPQNPGLNEFTKTQLQSIAAGYLMPYENLSGDLSNVTFISGRLGQIDFKKQVEYWQHTMFTPKFCDKIFSWFLIGAKLADGFQSDLKIKPTWTAPRWVMMDPTKEVKAMTEEVRSGFATWSEKVRENGYDPKEVLKELAQDQTNFETAGLMPTSNAKFELQAKMTMNAGKETGKTATKE